MERNPVVGGRCPQCGLYHADKIGCPNRPSRSPEQVLINPPKVPGTVEDSHAALSADMLQCDEAELPYQVVKWAARVEALGRVEEKKAAGCKSLETAWRCPGCGHLHTLKVVCGYDVESASKKEDADAEADSRRNS